MPPNSVLGNRICFSCRTLVFERPYHGPAWFSGTRGLTNRGGKHYFSRPASGLVFWGFGFQNVVSRAPKRVQKWLVVRRFLVHNRFCWLWLALGRHVSFQDTKMKSKLTKTVAPGPSQLSKFDQHLPTNAVLISQNNRFCAFVMFPLFCFVVTWPTWKLQE